MTVDAKLCFEKHIKQSYAKATAKLKTLTRIAPFMNIQKKKKKKKKILMKAFLRLYLAIVI